MVSGNFARHKHASRAAERSVATRCGFVLYFVATVLHANPGLLMALKAYLNPKGSRSE